MRKSPFIRPNSTLKNETKNNQIFIPKISSMIISEKIMKNLLNSTQTNQVQKAQPSQNLSPTKKNYLFSPQKSQRKHQYNLSNTSLNYVVTNSIKYYNPQHSFNKVAPKSGQTVSQIITKTANSFIKYDQNKLPLHKLITKIKNQGKEKRSISQLPTLSTERINAESQRNGQKRKKSVRFYDKVEYLIIGCQEGIEEYKYKFFEPLEQETVC